MCMVMAQGYPAEKLKAIQPNNHNFICAIICFNSLNLFTPNIKHGYAAQENCAESCGGFFPAQPSPGATSFLTLWRNILELSQSALLIPVWDWVYRQIWSSHMPTSMPGLWNSIRALMFCLQTALPPPPAPEGIPLPLVFSTQPFLPLLSSPFLPLPSMAIRWFSGRFSRVFEPHFWSHHKSQNRNALGYPAHRHALGYPAHRDALGYPAHRDALGYPAHRSFGLSSPQKCFGLSSPQKLWAIQPTEMLWAIQPTEALGYPTHRNALGYPAHRNALGYPAHRNVLGYPAHRNALGYPAHRNIYIQHTLPCASTHLIFSLHMSPYLFSFFSL